LPLAVDVAVDGARLEPFTADLRDIGEVGVDVDPDLRPTGHRRVVSNSDGLDETRAHVAVNVNLEGVLREGRTLRRPASAGDP
jgi:hypothetical protein